MKQKKIYWVLLFIFCLPLSLAAQDENEELEFSLEQAKEYAVKNNLNVQNAQIDVEIAEKKVWETTAIGLPQIKATADYQNMIEIPTQIMPDFMTPAVVGINQGIFGIEPVVPYNPNASSEGMPVQFGKKHNMNFGFSVSQIIFNGEYIVGLQASRTYKELSTKSLIKNEQDTKKSVEQAYYLVLVMENNKKVIDENLENTKKILTEIEAMHNAGIMEETDIDQMRLTVLRLENAQKSLERQVELSYQLLKYQMNLEQDKKVILTDNLDKIIKENDVLTIQTTELDINKNIDYQLLQTQEGLSALSLKQEQSKYLPSLVAFFSYEKNAMRDEFNFFDSDKEWYPTSIVGLSLEVPIFSSGQRWVKVQQAQLELKKTQNSKQFLEQSLETSVTKEKINLKNAVEKVETEKQSLALSQKIYDRTLIKYKEGMSSSLDLTQAQNQYLTAQQNYFNSILEMLNAQSNLKKTMGID